MRAANNVVGMAFFAGLSFATISFAATPEARTDKQKNLKMKLSRNASC